jgi:adenylate cyclase
MFTERATDITGIEPGRVLGRDVGEALAELAGLEVGYLTEVVRENGFLPLTKFELTLADGRKKSVYVRAHRMFDAAREPKGTVVLIDDITERELLFSAFSRYAPRELVRRLLAGGKPLRNEGQLCTATVLVAKLDQFAGITEDKSPFLVQSTLDDYFRAVVSGASLHGGFVDKIFGDRTVALFLEGSGEATALAAIRAARAVLERVEEANARRKEREAEPIRVAIGAATGEVVLGNLGDDERMDFAAMGDVVGIAEALAVAAEGGRVLAAESTAKLAGEGVAFESAIEVQAAGRHAAITARRLS